MFSFFYESMNVFLWNGYRTTKYKVIFTYTHPQAFDASLIKSVHVAGSFNDWTADDDNYKMATKGNQVYELELPNSSFNKGETYLYLNLSSIKLVG